MRTLFGISTIFLIVGLLVAPGCAFAAEFSSNGNVASDFKLSSSSEKINPEVKGGGGSRGGSSGFSSSKVAKKIDGDDDDDVDDGSGGFAWWIFIIIALIVLLAVAAVVWLVFLRNKG
jgi:hypothetical protein